MWILNMKLNTLCMSPELHYHISLKTTNNMFLQLFRRVMKHKFLREYFSWSKYLFCCCEWHLREYSREKMFPVAIYTFKYLYSHSVHLPMYFFLIYPAFFLVKDQNGFLWRLFRAFGDRRCGSESRSLSVGTEKESKGETPWTARFPF